MSWRMATVWILAWAVLATPASARAEVDLIGTWYVLIHYKDSGTHNPDVDRWLDKIWTFKEKGSRLEWTEYPIVVFNDRTGRFERFRGVRSRVLAAWQPNATQMAQIKGGLEINNRGSKSKSLRGSPARGYKSTSRMRAQSASVIGYVENWSVEDLQKNPVFTFDDIMGGGRTETMEGRTRYTGTAVSSDGNLIEGTYNRDGTRIGTFQLIRAGNVTRVAGKSEKVAAERRQLAIGGNLFGYGTRGGLADILRAAGGKIDLEELLQAIHAPPLEVSASVSLRQVDIVRLGDAGVEPIDYEDIKAGRVTPSDEDSYGVVTKSFCSSLGGAGTSFNWYLLPGNSLRAWDHTGFLEDCLMFNSYEPARGEKIELERQLVGYQKKKLPGDPMIFKLHLYRKGLALVGAGRIEDAEAMLARAEKAVGVGRQGTSGSGRGRSSTRAASESDRDALKERLTQAIATAKRTRVSSPQDSPAE